MYETNNDSDGFFDTIGEPDADRIGINSPNCTIL